MKYFVKKIEDKLVLASRDIQVGDKWFLTDGDSVTGSNIRKENEEWSPLMQKNAYKIIGEISPEALSYCKEGMEYDENGVSFEVCQPYEEDYSVDYKTWVEWENYKLIKIKGQCGHFH